MGIIKLRSHLIALSPVGPFLYPNDMYTDQTPNFRISEIIREQTINLTQDELPYSFYVEITNLSITKNRLIAHGTIWVERSVGGDDFPSDFLQSQIGSWRHFGDWRSALVWRVVRKDDQGPRTDQAVLPRPQLRRPWQSKGNLLQMKWTVYLAVREHHVIAK